MPNQPPNPPLRATRFDTPLGLAALAATPRGLCALALGIADADAALAELADGRILQRDDDALAPAVAAIRAQLAGGPPAALPLDPMGTPFERRAWDAIAAIPRGETRTYRQLALQLGGETLTRAVGRASARNRVALLIPCHRVVGSDGSLRGYRWGLDIKRRLLALESATLL